MTPTEYRSGNVVEVFSGIQGEGTHVGRRHLFLRLAGCPMGCRYCDQPEARTTPPRARIETRPGSRTFSTLRNPVSTDALVRALQRVRGRKDLHNALAITGGEPLVQAGFLEEFLPAARQLGLPVFLETNGTLPDALDALLPNIEIVSMDIKLRSATGHPMPLQQHERFLRQAVCSGTETIAKAVITSTTTRAEIGRVAALIARVAAQVPLVLQPVTPIKPHGGPRPPRPDDVLVFQDIALRRIRDVRVIPQTHKLIGQR